MLRVTDDVLISDWLFRCGRHAVVLCSDTTKSSTTRVVTTGGGTSVVGSAPEMPNGESSGNSGDTTDTKNDEQVRSKALSMTKFQSRRPPYTMHGVLHFIQHEWSRYEMERAKWELERAEMQVSAVPLYSHNSRRESAFCKANAMDKKI